MNRRWIPCTLLGCLACLAVPGAAPEEQDRTSKKPEIALVARPLMAFTPAKITFSADLRGGDDDYEELYCASVEWEWDDGTKSESSADCDPYQPGRSQIRRHYVAIHTYNTDDDYRPVFRLKKKDKVVASAVIDVKVRPGR